MCWAPSDGSSKFMPIDEEPNQQIVHAFRLGKAQRATNQPLDPDPEIDVLALDFLRVLLAHLMLLGIDVPLVGSPAVRVKLCDAKWLQELLQLEEDGVFAPSEHMSVSHLLHLAFFTELYDSRGQPYLVNSTMQSRTCIQLAVLPQGAESRSCAWQR